MLLRQGKSAAKALTWPFVCILLQAPTIFAGEQPRRDELMAAVDNHLQQCDRMYSEVDAKVAASEARFAGYYPVPDFPYLRTDRLMASYAKELDTRTRVGDWLYQLRDNEGFSRRIELRNLGMPLTERSALLNDLRLCAVWQSFQAFRDPDMREDLLAAVQPTDWADTALPYPAAPNRNQDKEFLFGIPRMFADQFGFGGHEEASTATLWKPNPDEPAPTRAEVRAHLAEAPRDSLGRVGSTQTWWRKLARFYAPNLLIATGGDRDRPGTPVMTDQGVRLDRSEVTIYYQPDFARVAQGTLMQFNYFIWFGAPGTASGDKAALDGLIWRVTLDPQGRPLAYESLRMDGHDHQWFPTPGLTPKSSVDPKLGRTVAEDAGPLVVPIETGSHDVGQVAPVGGTSAAETKDYNLARYEALFTLKVPGGGTRNLFDSNGLVRGGRAGDDGIRPRQYRHHPLASNEPWFFDNPHLLENVFQLPAEFGKTMADAGRGSGG